PHEGAAIGEGDIDIAGGAASEGGDVVAAVAVEVPGEGDLAAEAERVVPLHSRPHEGAAIGEGDVDVAGGAASEGSDVVAAVAVEVAHQRHLAAVPERVVPLHRAPDEGAAGGEGDEDVAGGAASEGGDVITAIAVEVTLEGDLAAEAE